MKIESIEKYVHRENIKTEYAGCLPRLPRQGLSWECHLLTSHTIKTEVSGIRVELLRAKEDLAADSFRQLRRTLKKNRQIRLRLSDNPMTSKQIQTCRGK
ncbi:hypothetical protein RUM44_009537 [Polyplax serrata]|uniref:Uncharacterized protein n=1 Tax=Polyplax serrata TaxID=468196 RepID=A0ABR1ASY8_POLSC